MTWPQCCTPRVWADMSQRHATTCPIASGRKLTIAEEFALRDFRLRKSIDRNLPSIDELAKSVEAHPSRHGLRLVDDPEYLDAHSDDDDDREVFPR